MKKIILFGILTLCFLTIFTGCTKKETANDALDKILQRDKLIVGVKYDSKPFGFINEKKELVGFDIDLAKYIANSILGDESKIEFREVTPSTRISAVNSGQVDMIIATMTITDQRKQVVDFSIPYYVAGQAILVPQNSDIKSISDLNGKKVIIIFGSTAENNLRMIAPNADIIGYKTYTSGYSALKQGQADAMTTDDTVLIGLAMEDPTLKLLPRRYTKEPYGIGLKKGICSAKLKKRINSIIETAQKEGELKNLENLWIKY